MITPGSWFRCEAHGGICVAYGLGHAMLFKPEDLASEDNDRVVAAAPELLAAVEHLRYCAQCAEGSWADCEGGKAALEAIQKVRGGDVL